MSLKKTSVFNVVLLLSLIVISCDSKKDKPEIYDEIVLKTGPYKITRYEYEKNKKKMQESQSSQDVESWLKEYIKSSYFLADAYHQKYDTISAISKKVNYAAITMLGQYKGYLWNKVEEPKLIFSEREINEIYKKRNKQFHLEYLLFPDKKTLNEISYNDAIIETEADFEQLVSRNHASSVELIDTHLLYPFDDLEPAKEQIYELKPGEVIYFPFKNDKILIAHLKKTTDVSQKKFEEERDNIYFNLRRIKEKQIVNTKQHSIFSQAKIEINAQLADSVLKKIYNKFPLEMSKNLLEDTLVNYVLKHQPRILLAADFFDYYHHNPFSYEVSTMQELIEALEGIVIEKYLHIESEELGITSEKKFILDKRDYMNRLVLHTYYQNNFYKTKISNEEMLEYYLANKQSFSNSSTCYVSVFAFADKSAAFFNLTAINKIVSQKGIQNLSDSSSMRDLISYEPDIPIDSKNTRYPTELVSKIFATKRNTPIGPVELENRAYIFIKTEEEGREIQPFDIAKPAIKEQLLAKNIEILKRKKLKELMNKYPIEINEIQINQ